MELTPENMRNLYYAFNAYLQKGLGGGWTDWTKYCSVINSATLIEKYPIVSIEDGLCEDDFEGWKQIAISQSKTTSSRR